MKAYLDIVKDVVENGIAKHPTRIENGKPVLVDNETIGLPNVIFRHNMKDGFPLLTTKKMAWRAIRVELEGFIKGITDKQWFKDRKCNIWNEWANPVSAKKLFDYSETEVPYNDYNRKMAQELCDDLGPIYGYQWRNFGQQYPKQDDVSYGTSLSSFPNGLFEGADQLKTIADKLKSNPYDRRMVCSAWNPNQKDMMALQPCHFAFNVVVYGDTLNLWWGQRSCDLMLGVPFNIASYALLLELLAKHAGLKAGNLMGVLGDCHVYSNHMEAARDQQFRKPLPLPTLSIKGDEDFDIFNWKWNDAKILNYTCHDKIDMDVTV